MKRDAENEQGRRPGRATVPGEAGGSGAHGTGRGQAWDRPGGSFVPEMRGQDENVEVLGIHFPATEEEFKGVVTCWLHVSQ